MHEVKPQYMITDYTPSKGWGISLKTAVLLALFGKVL